MNTMLVEQVKPHLHDVKCGRGNGSNMHHGNRYYQQRVLENRKAYKESRGNYAKNMIAASILDNIQNRSPPGRFLESRVDNNDTEIWSIITDQSALIKKIKQALRDDKKKACKKQDSSSLHTVSLLPSDSTSITLGSSISNSSPSHDNDGNYGGAMVSYSQGEVNNGWSSAPLPTLNASMSLLPFAVSPQGYASKDFSCIRPNPCGYYTNSFSTFANTDYQANCAEVSRTSSIMGGGGVRRNSDSLSLSLHSSDTCKQLYPSPRNIEVKRSVTSIDMEMLQDALRDSADSLISSQNSGMQLYVSVRSAESRDSLRSTMEMLQDALMDSATDSLSSKNSGVQFYVSVRSAETMDSLRSNDVEMLKDALKDSNTDSFISPQNSDVQLYAISVKSAETTNSLKIIDIEMLQDALKDSNTLSLSIQSSDIQLYESLKSTETRDSSRSVPIEILEDNFFD